MSVHPVADVATDTGARLAIDGPVAARTAPARHVASPRARRLARTAGVDLADVTGSGPSGHVREQDVRAATPELAAVHGRARLAVDGPVRPRVGPFRHTASPRARRLAAELAVPLDDVAGTVLPGRVTSVDVRRAAAATGDGPSTGPVTETSTSTAVDLDLGPLVTGLSALGPDRPADVPAPDAFLLVAHTVLGVLPGVASALHAWSGAALRAAVVRPGRVTARVDDGHDLTLLGFLRRLAAPVPSEDGTLVAIIDGSTGSLSSVLGATVSITVGPVSRTARPSTDDLGFPTTTSRPMATVVLHHDERHAAAVEQLVVRLRDQLVDAHRWTTA